jgi:hypothetical protein
MFISPMLTSNLEFPLAEVTDAAGNTQRVTSLVDFVIPTGGAYLFAPSISFLKSLT